MNTLKSFIKFYVRLLSFIDHFMAIFKFLKQNSKQRLVLLNNELRFFFILYSNFAKGDLKKSLCLSVRGIRFPLGSTPRYSSIALSLAPFSFPEWCVTPWNPHGKAVSMSLNSNEFTRSMSIIASSRGVVKTEGERAMHYMS